MTDQTGAIVGRDEEIKRLGAFLSAAAEAPAAVVLEGEAGIGKTTLWRWTLDTARGRDFTVLSASPAAAQTARSRRTCARRTRSCARPWTRRVTIPRCAPRRTPSWRSTCSSCTTP